MTINELFEKYKFLPSAQRRLLLAAPITAILLYAFMTAPHNPSPTRDASTAVAYPECSATKLQMSILGRSLVSYEWHSGVCPDLATRPHKVG